MGPRARGTEAGSAIRSWVLALAIMLTIPTIAEAGDGALDTGFDFDGRKTVPFNLGGTNHDLLSEVELQADGKIVGDRSGSGEVSAKLKVPKGRRGHPRVRKAGSFKLGPKQVALQADTAAKVRLRLPKRARKTAAKAIRGGATPKVKLAATGTDASGASRTRQKLTVKLRR